MKVAVERFGEVYTGGQDSKTFLQIQDRMGEVKKFDQIVSYRQPVIEIRLTKVAASQLQVQVIHRFYLEKVF